MSKNFYIALFIVVFQLGFNSSVFTQSKQFGSWNIINIKAPISNKASFVFETQLRSQSFYDNFFYHEYKGAVNFKLKKGFELLLGIGNYATYQFNGNFQKPIQNHELRPWQQLTYKHKIGNLLVDHRLRVEQRFFENNYKNRFRYRLNFVLPIGSKMLKEKSWYATSFNELFFNNEVPRFERNRFLLGAGYEFSKQFTIQTGWLFQYDIGRNRDFSKNFLQTSLLFTLPVKKEKNTVHFETLD
jgi:hypothetical protein